MRLLAGRANRKVLCAVPLLLAACAGGGRDTSGGPLGWDERIKATKAKRTSARSLAQAPRWGVMEPPAFVVVPDSVSTPDGKGAQRYVGGAVVTDDEKVVLLTEPRGPDPILLHIVDAVTGEETRLECQRRWEPTASRLFGLT